MPRSGYSALHGVNPKLKKKKAGISLLVNNLVCSRLYVQKFCLMIVCLSDL